MYTKVALLILRDNQYLLIKENHGYQDRSWNWPQGRVEEGEALEATALREGQEETGLSLRIERKLATLNETFPDTQELHVFLASALSEDLTLPAGEILDAKWVTREAMETMKDELVGEWILEVVRQL